MISFKDYASGKKSAEFKIKAETPEEERVRDDFLSIIQGEPHSMAILKEATNVHDYDFIQGEVRGDRVSVYVEFASLEALPKGYKGILANNDKFSIHFPDREIFDSIGSVILSRFDSGERIMPLIDFTKNNPLPIAVNFTLSLGEAVEEHVTINPSNYPVLTNAKNPLVLFSFWINQYENVKLRTLDLTKIGRCNELKQRPSYSLTKLQPIEVLGFDGDTVISSVNVSKDGKITNPISFTNCKTSHLHIHVSDYSEHYPKASGPIEWWEQLGSNYKFTNISNTNIAIEDCGDRRIFIKGEKLSSFRKGAMQGRSEDLVPKVGGDTDFSELF